MTLREKALEYLKMSETLNCNDDKISKIIEHKEWMLLEFAKFFVYTNLDKTESAEKSLAAFNKRVENEKKLGVLPEEGCLTWEEAKHLIEKLSKKGGQEEEGFIPLSSK